MKKLLAFNILVMLFTACSFISCDDVVTDDKGIVESIELADNYAFYGKTYKAEVALKVKAGTTHRYTLYTNKSYRVGDSIFIK